MNRCPIATLTVLILLPKPQDRYLMFVRWSEEDRSYVGYCPDLFPARGSLSWCNASRSLCETVRDRG